MSPWTLTMILLGAGVTSLAISTLGTALAIPLARRASFVDRPGAHKSHARATPYGGGIAIFVAAWLPLTAVRLTT